MQDAVIVALTAVTVAGINILPQLITNEKLRTILEKVGILEKHMIETEDTEQIRNKFRSIQTYYIQKIMDEEFRTIGVFKTDTFIKLICDYVLDLDFDDLNDYTGFHDHLCSASKFNRQRMIEVLGEEQTNKYYTIHLKHLADYNAKIQKIFFTNGNSKKNKIISISIDFLQLFMTELVNLSLKKEVGIDITMSRRMDDVASRVIACEKHSEVENGNNKNQ